MLLNNRPASPASGSGSLRPRLLGCAALIGLAVTLGGCGSTSSTDLPAGQSGRLDRSLFDAAEGSEGHKDYIAAATYYRALYNRDPEDLTAVVGLARSLRKLQTPAEAQAILRRAMANAPRDPALLAEMGKVQLALGDAPQAIDSLSRAATLGAQGWDVLSALAVAYDRIGMYEQADRRYRQALELTPENAVVLNNYALSQAQAGQLGDAVRLLERAVALPEATARMRQNLALFYALRGDIAAAESLVRRDMNAADAENNMAYLRRLQADRGSHIAPPRPTTSLMPRPLPRPAGQLPAPAGAAPQPDRGRPAPAALELAALRPAPQAQPQVLPPPKSVVQADKMPALPVAQVEVQAAAAPPAEPRRAAPAEAAAAIPAAVPAAAPAPVAAPNAARAELPLASEFATVSGPARAVPDAAVVPALETDAATRDAPAVDEAAMAEPAIAQPAAGVPAMRAPETAEPVDDELVADEALATAAPAAGSAVFDVDDPMAGLVALADVTVSPAPPAAPPHADDAPLQEFDVGTVAVPGDWSADADLE